MGAPWEAYGGTATEGVPSGPWDAYRAPSQQGHPTKVTVTPDKYQQAAQEEDKAIGGADAGFTRRLAHGATLGADTTVLAGLETPLEMIKRGTLNPAEAYKYAKAREDLIMNKSRENTGLAGTLTEALGGGISAGGLANAGVTAGRYLPQGASLLQRAGASALDAAGIGGVSGAMEGNGLAERGENAVYEAARAVAKLEHFDFGIAPHALLGSPTLNVGTIAGGLNINSVPDEARIGIDIRTVAGQDHAALHATLAGLLGPRVELEPILDVGSVYTDPADPWVAEVFEIMAPILNLKPEPRSVSYFTDAAALRPAYGNPPTVILGPGEPQMAHQTDEYCVADRIRQAVQAYGEIIGRWCL